ncbi:MAG: YggS family pyridoxal phosphate-dependent enzyme [Acidobacteria bacterium]|nr:YggS family pyridoxal phosphate-dependent enzyme [Acidobacteriota bacterium]
MAAAARRAGRDPAGVKLVAVAKTFPPATVMALAAEAPVIIGENKVQEAEEKIPQVEPAGAFEWHMIGHLQSNKARHAVELFHMIHSVDSRRLLDRLERYGGELGKELPVLIQVNVGGEASKSGCEEAELEDILAAAAGLRWLRVRGLMTIPPFLNDPEDVRPYFRRLRRMAEIHDARLPSGLSLTELSMGMSHDFEVAIEEGATLIRVGTAVFGTRD